jgi:hypothetical protein
MFDRLSDRHLRAVYRVAKTRLRAFFVDPKMMIQLRSEMYRRGML